MAFPLTKYAVVGVFTVVFIFAIDALTPMELFYEVYTEHKGEVDDAIGICAAPLFIEDMDALCRCFFEKFMVIISPTDKSIHAFISKSVTYNFLYDKPLKNIQTSLLSCHKNKRNSDIYVAFSNDADEYFYVDVLNSGQKTSRVVKVFNVDGLKDNDRAKLSTSPYWCRIAAELRHNSQWKVNFTRFFATVEEYENVADVIPSEKELPGYTETLFMASNSEVKNVNVEPMYVPSTSNATIVQHGEERDESLDAPSSTYKINVKFEIESDKSSDAPVIIERTKNVQVLKESAKSLDVPSMTNKAKVRVKEENVESLDAPATCRATAAQLEDEFEEYSVTPTASKEVKVQFEEEGSLDAIFTTKRIKIDVVGKNNKSSNDPSTSNTSQIQDKEEQVEFPNKPAIEENQLARDFAIKLKLD